MSSETSDFKWLLIFHRLANRQNLNKWRCVQVWENNRFQLSYLVLWTHFRWYHIRTEIQPSLPLNTFVYFPAVTSPTWETWNKCTLNQMMHSGSAQFFILTLEARFSFFMACIIPRRPWHPEVSLRPGPAAGELSCDATSELGMMLMLSDAEALSSKLGSAPFRQLRVFLLLWGGGSFSSVGGATREIKELQYIVDEEMQLHNNNKHPIDQPCGKKYCVQINKFTFVWH